MTDAMLGEMPETSTRTVDSRLGQTYPTLQRGGEALVLEKVDDRFTICPAGYPLEAVLQPFVEIAANPITRLIPAIASVEIQSTADQLEPLIQAARAAEKIAYASHVYRIKRSPGTLVYLTNQITLQFADVTSEQMHEIAASVGLQILKLVASVPKAFVFQITRSATANPLKLAEQLSQHPEVLLAEPNVAVLRQPFYRPRESEYRQQWYLQTEGGDGIAAGAHIFAEAAWNLTRGNRSISVAVVDDGVDLNHPDFQSEGKIVAPVALENLQENWQNLQHLDLPLPTHGTATARLAVADETGKGIIGVAPGCALMPICIGEFIDDQMIERLCQWVIDKGADVVCCGWGAAALYFPLSLRQRVALSQAATQGRDGRGCVLVFAAGNANRPIDGVIDEQGWENQFLQGKTHWLNGFALHPDVISVAACTSLNQKSASSNWGAGLSLAAPGGHASPTIYTQETGVLATAPMSTQQPGQPVYLGQTNQTNQTTGADVAEPLLGDTSSACALVAGVAALVLSINPDLRAQEVRQILEQTADRVVDREPDMQLGLCLGNYDANRYSGWFGYGKVNAIKAVQLAQSQQLPFTLPNRWVSYASQRPVEIPDGDPQGVISVLEVPEASAICDLEISVEVEHEFLGDVEIYLLPPWGKPILLQSRKLGGLTNLKTTYSLENTLWLKSALNRSAKGQWRLQLIDRVPACTGHLQRWQLNLGL